MDKKLKLILITILVIVAVGGGFLGISYVTQRQGMKQGIEYLEKKEYQKAYQSFDKASNKISIIWTNQKTNTFYYKGEALYELERYEDAIRIYDDILDNDKEGKAYAMKALCYMGMQQPDEALTILDQGIKECPTDADCYDMKIAVLSDQKKYDQALEVVNIALSQKIASGKDDILWNQISLYEAKNEYQKAYECAKEYVKTYPKDAKGKKELSFLESRI